MTIEERQQALMETLRREDAMKHRPSTMGVVCVLVWVIIFVVGGIVAGL